MLNDEQQKAIKILSDTNVKRIMLQGGAGVGKTFTIGSYIKNSKEDIIICALTNSASKVLQKTLKDDYGIDKKVLTLHSVLKLRPNHNFTTTDGKKLTKFEPTINPSDFEELKYNTLIIDESSMICEDLYKYISEIKIDRIIFVGDFYQLKCVDGKPFKFKGVNVVLDKIVRSDGELAIYHKSLRKEIDMNVNQLSLFKDSKYFTNKNDFIKYVDNYDGSKIVLSYTNNLADEYAEILDNSEVYVGQECITSGNIEVSGRGQNSKNKLKIANNENVMIDKVFSNYAEMCLDADISGYSSEWFLPNKSRLYDFLCDVTYLKVINENGDYLYISKWNGSKGERDDIIAKKINQIGRDLLSELREKIPKSLFHLKDSTILAQMKTMGLMSEEQEYRYSKELWYEYFVFKNSLILRSKISTTIHKSQGMSVDLCAIDLDSSRMADLDLQYVAFTRSKKEIVYYSRRGY